MFKNCKHISKMLWLLLAMAPVCSFAEGRVDVAGKGDTGSLALRYKADSNAPSPKAQVDAGAGERLDLKGNSLSLEAWFKTGNTGKAYPLISKFDTDWKRSFKGYSLCVEANNCLRLWLAFGDSAKNFDTGAFLEPNRFYHVAAVYDGKTVKIYSSGQLKASMPEFRDVAANPKAHLKIGGGGAEALVEQAKIHDKAMGKAELAASYLEDGEGTPYHCASKLDPQGKDSPNLLINSSFRRASNPEIPDCWGTALASAVERWKGCFGIDDAMKPPVEGVRCLRVNNPFPPPTGFWFCSTWPLLPGGKDYTFSLYLKADTPGMTASISGFGGYGKFAVSQEWRRYSATGFNTTTMREIAVEVVGRGSLWAAAPQLEYGKKTTPYVPADSESSLDEPGAPLPQERSLPSKEASGLSAFFEYNFYTGDKSATLFLEWGQDTPVNVDVLLDGQRQYAHRLEGRAARQLQIPIDALKEGRHMLTAKAMSGEGKELAAAKDSLLKLAASPIEVRINRKTRMLAFNGAPLPLYGPCLDLNMLRYAKGGKDWQGNTLSPSGCDSWPIEDIRAHGFNCVYVVFRVPAGKRLESVEPEWRQLLDECERKGLKVVFYMGIPGDSTYMKFLESMLEIVRRFKDHPAIVAWNFIDEPDGWWETAAGGKKEADIGRLFLAIKDADPYRPAFVNWMRLPLYGGLESSDIGSIDRYPCRMGVMDFDPDGLSRLAITLNDSTRKTHKPSFLFMQMYGYWDGSREPTPAEMKWTTYVNFIMGTRGLFYFIYKPMSESLWESTIPLGDEVRNLFKIASCPGARELETCQEGGVLHSLWQSDGKYYLVFANGAMRPTTFTFDLERRLAGGGGLSPTPLSSPMRIHKDASAMTLELKPLESGVIELSEPSFWDWLGL